MNSNFETRRRKAIFALSALTLLTTTSVASASMPTLTQLPTHAELDGCITWAVSQGEEASFMWGQTPAGNSREDIARLRLTLFCLGDEIPAIVGVGSSAGATQAYCTTHADQPICNSEPVSFADGNSVERLLPSNKYDTALEIEFIERYFAEAGGAALLEAQALLSASGAYDGEVDGRWGDETSKAFDDILQGYIAIGGKTEEWDITSPADTPRLLGWIAQAHFVSQNGGEFPD